LTIRSTRAESQPQPSLAFSTQVESSGEGKILFSTQVENGNEGKNTVSTRVETFAEGSGLFSTAYRHCGERRNPLTVFTTKAKKGIAGQARNDGKAKHNNNF
jgi:hypothetical protein